jgi:signal transduction histidine kinase
MMLRERLTWPIRVFCFALVGILTFLLQPQGATAVRAQLVGYLVAGAGLLAWALMDMYGGAARQRGAARYAGAGRHRGWMLPVILGVIAAAAGFASTAGISENNCPVILANVASVGAGLEFDLLVGWLVTLTGILALDVNWIIYRSGFSQVSSFLLLPLVPLSGLLLGRIVRGRQLHAEQSAAMLAQTQELLSEQGRADVLAERARIAREIHDVLAHSLGALGIQIQAARAVLTDHKDVDRAVDILLTAQRMAADGLTETRRAVHALRIDSRPLDEELGRVTSIHREYYHVDATFDVSGVPRPLPPDATIALLRTAQEALVNAAKHAAGQDVAVHLDYGDRDVRLAVVNNLAQGRAAAPVTQGSVAGATLGSVGGGYGLTGMNERLRLLNGTLTACSHDGQWTVTAELPLAAADQPQDDFLNGFPVGQPQDVTS